MRLYKSLSLIEVFNLLYIIFKQKKRSSKCGYNTEWGKLRAILESVLMMVGKTECDK